MTKATTRFLIMAMTASLTLFGCDDDGDSGGMGGESGAGAAGGSDSSGPTGGAGGEGGTGGVGAEGGAGGAGTEGGAGGLGAAGGADGAGGAGDADGMAMGPSCGDFVPCGGNAAGEWDFATECLPFVYPEPDDFCPDGSFEFVRTPLGTLSLRMDGTMTLNQGFRAQFVTTLPAACLDGMTCEQLEAQYNPDPDGAFPTTCSVNDDISGCVCTDTFEDEPSPRNGVWEPLQDRNILIIFEGEEPQIALFCAEGDTLLIQPLEDEDDTGLGPVYGLTRQ